MAESSLSPSPCVDEVRESDEQTCAWMGSQAPGFFLSNCFVANANADEFSRQALVEDAEDGRQISAGGCGGVTPTDTELCEH